MTNPNENDDLWEIFKVFAFAGIVTWIPFSVIELYIPAVDKQLQWEKKCEEKGGFVYDVQNQEKLCIKKDYVIIIP